MRLITWSHDPQAKTASIDPPRKMRPLPIWNQRVHSQKSFWGLISEKQFQHVPGPPVMLRKAVWSWIAWLGSSTLISHWGQRHFCVLLVLWSHWMMFAVTCMDIPVPLLFFWRCLIYILQYNNYLHFLHKRTSDTKCPSSDSCWMALN